MFDRIPKPFWLLALSLSWASSDPRFFDARIVWNSLRRFESRIPFQCWLDMSPEVVRDLLRNWSAKFSHSAGARFRFWNVSRRSSGRVSEAVFFNLAFCLVFGVGFDWTSRFEVSKVEVDCSLLWSTAVAVSFGDVSGLSPGFLLFVFFSDLFNATSSCVLGPGIELGPAVFDFARLMARFRPPPDSGSFEVMNVWRCWNQSNEFTARRSSSSESMSSKFSGELILCSFFCVSADGLLLLLRVFSCCSLIFAWAISDFL